MLEALVLAGGASTRMGSPKALLADPDGSPFIVRIVSALAEAGLARVVVVTGAHHQGIVDACSSHPTLADMVRCVRNPDPGRGQLSSLLVGMDAVVGPETEGLLVTLVDVPMVTSDTVRRVVRAWVLRRAPIVRPSVGGAHGHPVIFDRQVFANLRAAPLELGAKVVVRSHASRLENVPVEDAGCLLDIDTPDDYAQLGASPQK